MLGSALHKDYVLLLGGLHGEPVIGPPRYMCSVGGIRAKLFVREIIGKGSPSKLQLPGEPTNQSCVGILWMEDSEILHHLIYLIPQY